MQFRPWKIVLLAALAGLAGPALAHTGSGWKVVQGSSGIIARVGDDCWRGELSCQASRSGTKVVCAKRHRP